MSEYELYRSRASAQATAHPVFFYHIPKCGGMTVHSLAFHAWSLFVAAAGITQKPLIARCDTPENFQSLQGQHYIFISSHMPYGTHTQLRGRPLLMTFLRDPVKRVLSNYTYDQMRADAPVSLDGFAKFFEKEENTNVIAKLLSGKTEEQKLAYGDAEQAKFTLDNEFAFVGTTAHIKAICERYLQYCGLPNVLSQVINPTLEKYTLDIADVADEVRERNADDQMLFEHVRDRGVVMPDVPDAGEAASDSLNALTVLISERGGQEGSMTSSRLVPTAELKYKGLLADDGTCDSAGLDAYFES